MVFYCDKEGKGISVAQYIGFETCVTISIFEVSNISQYLFLCLYKTIDTLLIYNENTVEQHTPYLQHYMYIFG
jgi:hypothetical protein